MIIRDFSKLLYQRLHEPDLLIQVILGPRQVGKTTGVMQIIQGEIGKPMGPYHYVSADEFLSLPTSWIHEEWDTAEKKGPGTILIIDEIQKIVDWSQAIKILWDKQKRTRPPSERIKCVLLGSSSLALQIGLSESLAGRFELIHAPHWNYLETKAAFGFDLKTYLAFGGYPGASGFIQDYPRWFNYLKNSVIEAVIGKDILSLRTVNKPALFRQTFEMLCGYPAQIISFTKLLGQLQDKGNTDLIQYYLELYEGAFLFRTLRKFALGHIQKKSSIPKILPLCPAFFSLHEGPDIIRDSTKMGRLFECAVGANLAQLPGELYYWKDGAYEVDYVYKWGNSIYAVEVKSSPDTTKGLTGLHMFRDKFPQARTIVLDMESYEQFLLEPFDFLQRWAR